MIKPPKKPTTRNNQKLSTVFKQLCFKGKDAYIEFCVGKVNLMSSISIFHFSPIKLYTTNKMNHNND